MLSVMSKQWELTARVLKGSQVQSPVEQLKGGVGIVIGLDDSIPL